MKIWILVGSAGMAVPVAAFGQDDDDDRYGDDRYGADFESPLVPGNPDIPSGFGNALMIGGGTMDRLTTDGAENATSTGGSWLARYVLGTRSILAGELAYLGSAVPVDNRVTGGSGSGMLLSNGGEVDLRVQAPIPVGVDDNVALAPFILGGFALLGHGVVGSDGGIDDNTSLGDRLTAHLPLGAGLAVMTGGFIADARISYRPTIGGDNPVFNGRTAFDNSMNGLAITGSVGFEF